MNCPQGVSKSDTKYFSLLGQCLQTKIPGSETEEMISDMFSAVAWMHFPAAQLRVTDFFSLRCRIQEKGAKPYECVFVASETRSCQDLWFGYGMSSEALFLPLYLHNRLADPMPGY